MQDLSSVSSTESQAGSFLLSLSSQTNRDLACSHPNSSIFLVVLLLLLAIIVVCDVCVHDVCGGRRVHNTCGDQKTTLFFPSIFPWGQRLKLGPQVYTASPFTCGAIRQEPPVCLSVAWIYVFLGHQCDNVCCESLSKVVSWAEYTGKLFPRSHFYTWEFSAWELSWIYAGIEPELWSQWPAFSTRWKASSPASCLSERHFRFGRTLRLLLFLHGELRPRGLWRLNNQLPQKNSRNADLGLSSRFILHLEFAPWPFSPFLRWLFASVSFFFFKCLGEGLPLFLGLLFLFASEKLG